MYVITLMFSLARTLYGEIWFWSPLGVKEYASMHLPSAEFILCLISGSRGSRHSTDSGATSDSGEARDTMYDELSSPFRSDIETSPPVSPTSPISFQKGAYISKVKAESTHLLNGSAGREIIWLLVRKYVPSATRSSCDDREPNIFLSSGTKLVQGAFSRRPLFGK